MRYPDFPFAKYRAWDETPAEVPELDTTSLLELGEWQAGIYKKPVFDDITAYPNFYPSPNAAMNYTTRPTRRTLLRQSPVELGISYEDWQGRVERQPKHVAEQVELVTAISWTAARMRYAALTKAIRRTNDWAMVEGPQDQLIIDADEAVIAADAIADYGYTLRHPAELNHLGHDNGPALAAQVERVAGNIGMLLERFGLFAGDHPEVLQTADGLTTMEVVLEEQSRRADYWGKRHEAITSAYRDLPKSDEILYERLPLDEIITIQASIAGNKS